MFDSNDFDDFDVSLTERVRLVQLLDLDPGTRGCGADTKKIVMLRLGHGGEIEQPLAFSLWDARRLTTLLIRALDHHGDSLGESLILGVPDDEHQSSWFEEGDPDAQLPAEATGPPRLPRGNAMSAERPFFAKRKLTDQSPTRVQVVMKFGTGRQVRRVFLHGGYRDGSTSILLYRIRTSKGIHDGLLWVTRTNKWLGEMEIADEACVPLYHWPQFFLIPEGNKLVLGDGTRWSKMTAAEVGHYHGRILEPMFRVNLPKDSRRRGG